MSEVLPAYRGYTGTVEYSEEDGVFHGGVAGIRGVVGFEGASVDDLERDFRDAVDYYLALCAKNRETQEVPVLGWEGRA